MEFIEKRAHELYTSSSGLSKSADQFGFGYPFLSYSDIFHNYYVTDELTTLVNSTEKDREKCSVKRGDVFLTRTSETTEELGMSCVALNTIENATFNGFAKRLRPITDEIVPEYAAYYFRSSYFRAQCMSMASLITRASLNDSMISRLKIRYPRKKEDQILLGDILMNYDKLIRNNSKRIISLEKVVEDLYKEWFVRFRFPGSENVQFEKENPRGWIYGNSEITYRPSDWHFGELRELGEFIRGKNITSDKMVEGNIPVVSAGLQPSGYHNKANVFGYSLSISASGANAGYLLYHLNDIWAADCSYYQNDSNLWYVYSSLKFLQPVISNMQAGAAQPHVYPKHVNRLSVLIPTNEWINKYCEVVEPIFKQIKLLKEKNENLIKQRDMLLPRLMSGKLEVK